VQYRALLRKIDGSVAEFRTYRVDRITGVVVGMDLSKAMKTFPAVARNLESPVGLIHLFIGMDHVDNAPKEQERSKNLVLYRSVFRSGYMVCGNMAQPEEDRHGAVCIPRTGPLKVLSCKSTFFLPPEFITSEAMATELPTRCPACKNCKECQF
jgi:hypothetical protein